MLANSLIPSETLSGSPDFNIFKSEVEAFETAWKKAEDSVSKSRLRKFSKYSNRFPFSSWDSSKNVINKEKILLVVELNSADTFDLQRLSGIGPAFARRIVNYRTRIGGFYNKQQLMEVFGMDSVRYQFLLPHISVNRDSIHRIDLNNITFKELLRHPYFPFDLTKSIMLYRQKIKKFKSLEEIKQINGINDSIYQKIVIYLKVQP
ncbi:MAG: helix-hairpin-helix domain-containing protein [Bacteroidales bacterium]|nr:helix-hairpin-helix domain-containing protein [Bacteroidales bacterium]MDD4602858.1 helix-hairpin-helix domain-containing protein [Bacteroidales bacterium]